MWLRTVILVGSVVVLLLAVYVPMLRFPRWSPFIFVGYLLVLMAGAWLLDARNRRALARARRGLCASCGYDVRASAERCPECGKRIPHGSPLIQQVWRLRRRAQRMLDNARVLHDQPREYGPLDVAAAADPSLDRGFFDGQRQILVTSGFRHVGDVEDLTSRRIYGGGRSAYRVMISEDGHIVASIGQFTNANERFVQMISELSDGTFLVTDDFFLGEDGRGRPGAILPIPGIDHRRRVGLFDVEALVRAQRDALRAKREELVAAEPRSFETLEETLALAQRIHDAHGRYRRTIGYFDEKSFRAANEGQFCKAAQALLAEIRRIRREEQKART
jgi:hypothetical protein